MKKIVLLACLFLIAMSGCRAVSSVANSITGTDDSLLAQVPEDKMAPVDDARFQVTVAEERVKLAQLREDLLDYQEKLSERELDRAKNMREQREIELDLAKAEVIAAAGLSDPVESAKDINGFKQDLLQNEAELIDIDDGIRKEKERITSMQQQVSEQERHIAEMTGQTKVDPGMAPEEAVEPADDSIDMETEEKEEVTLPDYLKVEDDPDAGVDENGSAVEEGALPE